MKLEERSVVPRRESDFLIKYKVYSSFHLWKATVHFVKKFEDEELIYMTAGAVFFNLYSICRDREEI